MQLTLGFVKRKPGQNPRVLLLTIKKNGDLLGVLHGVGVR